MKTTYWIAGVLAVGLGAGVASMAVANQGGPNRPSFEALDADKDGKVTQAELDAHKAQEFAKADADGDGMLSAAEMLARAKVQENNRMANRVNKMIARIDADKDGMVSAAEMQAMPRGKGMLRRMDADNDGTITAAEYAAHKPGRGMRDGKRGGMHDGKRGGHGHMQHKGPFNNAPATE